MFGIKSEPEMELEFMELNYSNTSIKSMQKECNEERRILGGVKFYIDIIVIFMYTREVISKIINNIIRSIKLISV
jgi:hypothetical protein